MDKRQDAQHMISIFYARYIYSNPGGPVFLSELNRRSDEGVRVVDVTQLTPEVVTGIAASSRVIAIDQSVYNAATWTEPGAFSPYFIVDHRPRDHYQQILESLLAVSVAKIFVTNIDLHDKRNVVLVERLHGRVDAISWMFEKRPMAISDVPLAYRDAWLTADHDPVEVWNAVRAAFPVRVELPFALGRHEVFATDAGSRWDVCTIGAPYRTRQIARQSIRRAGLRAAPAQVQHVATAIAIRILPRIMPGRTASEAFIKLQQSTQRALVRGARCTFVCGGPLAFPVRKFFEIPGARSALVAMPCIGFEDFGFHDGINAITTSPEDAGATVKRLINDEALRSRMVRAALQTVRELHSVERRVTDFLICVNRLAVGQLRRAEFLGGTFVIE